MAFNRIVKLYFCDIGGNWQVGLESYLLEQYRGTLGHSMTTLYPGFCYGESK